MAAAQRVYEEHYPPIKWENINDCPTLILDLPKFKKNNLRVQITSIGTDRMVRIQGERQEQGNKWLRFMEQYPVPPDTIIDKVTATFDSDKLNINFPKKINPQDAPKKEENNDKEQSAEPALPQREDGLAGDRKAKKDDIVSEKAEKTERDGVREMDESAKKMEGNQETNGGGRKVHEKYYKQGAGNLVELIRRPGMLVRLGVGVLLVMALCLCMRNAISSHANANKNE